MRNEYGRLDWSYTVTVVRNGLDRLDWRYTVTVVRNELEMNLPIWIGARVDFDGHDRMNGNSDSYSPTIKCILLLL